MSDSGHISAARRALRNQSKVTSYGELDEDELDNVGIPPVECRKLYDAVLQGPFPTYHVDCSPRLVTSQELKSHGFRQPIVVRDPGPSQRSQLVRSLGMRLPDYPLTVSSIKVALGHSHMVRTIDVMTQGEGPSLEMSKWEKYFHNQERRSKRLLNVVSLGLGGTILEQQVKPPQAVQDLDLVSCVWPEEMESSRPQVLLYALMSPAGSYTDFHIDFGGSSVWYHLISGKKVFILAPPTTENLDAFQAWASSPTQSQTAFCDLATGVKRIELNAGDTLLLPGGWPHAVSTPVDSVAVGGNFLHALDLALQLNIWEREQRMKVQGNSKFPRFKQLMWLTLRHYLPLLKKHKSAVFAGQPGVVSKYELEGLKVLRKHWKQLMPAGKADVPGIINHPEQLLNEVGGYLQVLQVKSESRADRDASLKMMSSQATGVEVMDRGVAILQKLMGGAGGLLGAVAGGREGHLLKREEDAHGGQEGQALKAVEEPGGGQEGQRLKLVEDVGSPMKSPNKVTEQVNMDGGGERSGEKRAAEENEGASARKRVFGKRMRRATATDAAAPKQLDSGTPGSTRGGTADPNAVSATTPAAADVDPFSKNAGGMEGGAQVEEAGKKPKTEGILSIDDVASHKWERGDVAVGSLPSASLGLDLDVLQYDKVGSMGHGEWTDLGADLASLLQSGSPLAADLLSPPHAFDLLQDTNHLLNSFPSSPLGDPSLELDPAATSKPSSNGGLESLLAGVEKSAEVRKEDLTKLKKLLEREKALQARVARGDVELSDGGARLANHIASLEEAVRKLTSEADTSAGQNFTMVSVDVPPHSVAASTHGTFMDTLSHPPTSHAAPAPSISGLHSSGGNGAPYFPEDAADTTAAASYPFAYPAIRSTGFVPTMEVPLLSPITPQSDSGMATAGEAFISHGAVAGTSARQSLETAQPGLPLHTDESGGPAYDENAQHTPQHTYDWASVGLGSASKLAGPASKERDDAKGMGTSAHGKPQAGMAAGQKRTRDEGQKDREREKERERERRKEMERDARRKQREKEKEKEKLKAAQHKARHGEMATKKKEDLDARLAAKKKEARDKARRSTATSKPRGAAGTTLWDDKWKVHESEKSDLKESYSIQQLRDLKAKGRLQDTTKVVHPLLSTLTVAEVLGTKPGGTHTPVSRSMAPASHTNKSPMPPRTHSHSHDPKHPSTPSDPHKKTAQNPKPPGTSLSMPAAHFDSAANAAIPSRPQVHSGTRAKPTDQPKAAHVQPRPPHNAQAPSASKRSRVKFASKTKSKKELVPLNQLFIMKEEAWSFLDSNGREQGPYSQLQLKIMLMEGKIKEDIFVSDEELDVTMQLKTLLSTNAKVLEAALRHFHPELVPAAEAGGEEEDEDEDEDEDDDDAQAGGEEDTDAAHHEDCVGGGDHDMVDYKDNVPDITDIDPHNVGSHGQGAGGVHGVHWPPQQHKSQGEAHKHQRRSSGNDAQPNPLSREEHYKREEDSNKRRGGTLHSHEDKHEMRRSGYDMHVATSERVTGESASSERHAEGNDVLRRDVHDKAAGSRLVSDHPPSQQQDVTDAVPVPDNDEHAQDGSNQQEDVDVLEVNKVGGGRDEGSFPAAAVGQYYGLGGHVAELGVLTQLLTVPEGWNVMESDLEGLTGSLPDREEEEDSEWRQVVLPVLTASGRLVPTGGRAPHTPPVNSGGDATDGTLASGDQGTSAVLQQAGDTTAAGEAVRLPGSDSALQGEGRGPVQTGVSGSTAGVPQVPLPSLGGAVHGVGGTATHGGAEGGSQWGNQWGNQAAAGGSSEGPPDWLLQLASQNPQDQSAAAARHEMSDGDQVVAPTAGLIAGQSVADTELSKQNPTRVQGALSGAAKQGGDGGSSFNLPLSLLQSHDSSASPASRQTTHDSLPALDFTRVMPPSSQPIGVMGPGVHAARAAPQGSTTQVGQQQTTFVLQGLMPPPLQAVHAQVAAVLPPPASQAQPTAPSSPPHESLMSQLHQLQGLPGLPPTSRPPMPVLQMHPPTSLPSSSLLNFSRPSSSLPLLPPRFPGNPPTSLPGTGLLNLSGPSPTLLPLPPGFPGNPPTSLPSTGLLNVLTVSPSSQLTPTPAPGAGPLNIMLNTQQSSMQHISSQAVHVGAQQIPAVGSSHLPGTNLSIPSGAGYGGGSAGVFGSAGNWGSVSYRDVDSMSFVHTGMAPAGPRFQKGPSAAFVKQPFAEGRMQQDWNSYGEEETGEVAGESSGGQGGLSGQVEGQMDSAVPRQNVSPIGLSMSALATAGPAPPVSASSLPLLSASMPTPVLHMTPSALPITAPVLPTTAPVPPTMTSVLPTTAPAPPTMTPVLLMMSNQQPPPSVGQSPPAFVAPSHSQPLSQSPAFVAPSHSQPLSQSPASMHQNHPTPAQLPSPRPPTLPSPSDTPSFPTPSKPLSQSPSAPNSSTWIPLQTTSSTHPSSLPQPPPRFKLPGVSPADDPAHPAQPKAVTSLPTMKTSTSRTTIKLPGAIPTAEPDTRTAGSMPDSTSNASHLSQPGAAGQPEREAGLQSEASPAGTASEDARDGDGTSRPAAVKKPSGAQQEDDEYDFMRDVTLPSSDADGIDVQAPGSAIDDSARNTTAKVATERAAPGTVESGQEPAALQSPSNEGAQLRPLGLDFSLNSSKVGKGAIQLSGESGGVSDSPVGPAQQMASTDRDKNDTGRRDRQQSGEDSKSRSEDVFVLGLQTAREGGDSGQSGRDVRTGHGTAVRLMFDRDQEQAGERASTQDFGKKDQNGEDDGIGDAGREMRRKSDFEAGTRRDDAREKRGREQDGDVQNVSRGQADRGGRGERVEALLSGLQGAQGPDAREGSAPRDWNRHKEGEREQEREADGRNFRGGSGQSQQGVQISDWRGRGNAHSRTGQVRGWFDRRQDNISDRPVWNRSTGQDRDNTGVDRQHVGSGAVGVSAPGGQHMTNQQVTGGGREVQNAGSLGVQPSVDQQIAAGDRGGPPVVNLGASQVGISQSAGSGMGIMGLQAGGTSGGLLMNPGLLSPQQGPMPGTGPPHLGSSLPPTSQVGVGGVMVLQGLHGMPGLQIPGLQAAPHGQTSSQAPPGPGQPGAIMQLNIPMSASMGPQDVHGMSAMHIPGLQNTPSLQLSAPQSTLPAQLGSSVPVNAPAGAGPGIPGLQGISGMQIPGLQNVTYGQLPTQQAAAAGLGPNLQMTQQPVMGMGPQGMQGVSGVQILGLPNNHPGLNTNQLPLTGLQLPPGGMQLGQPMAALAPTPGQHSLLGSATNQLPGVMPQVPQQIISQTPQGGMPPPLISGLPPQLNMTNMNMMAGTLPLPQQAVIIQSMPGMGTAPAMPPGPPQPMPVGPPAPAPPAKLGPLGPMRREAPSGTGTGWNRGQNPMMQRQPHWRQQPR